MTIHGPVKEREELMDEGLDTLFEDYAQFLDSIL
jgi:hypothetical protein